MRTRHPLVAMAWAQAEADPGEVEEGHQVPAGMVLVPTAEAMVQAPAVDALAAHQANPVRGEVPAAARKKRRRSSKPS